MKKVLIFIAAVALGLLPTMAFATSAAPWGITNLTDTFIFPNLVNGTPKGILVSASSTINGAFTIATSTSGCATFSPTGLIYSTGVGCGTGSGSSTFGTTSISATAPLNWNTTTATMSITQAGTGANGYLSSTDFNTFNNKIASTSLSGVGGTSYNSTTGVISSFSYPFPSNATTTALTLGGLTLSNLAGGGTLCVHVNNSGTLSTTASDCGSSGGTVTSVTATYPIISSGGTTPNISTAFGTTTNSGITAGNLYVGAGGIFQSTATGTVSNGTGISVTAGQSVIGSGLTITNTSPLSGLTTAFPLSFSNPALSWIGLATSSALSQGGALYATGVNTIASTPTTTVTCTGSASCTAFTVFGASPITINASGGSGGSGTVSTSTNETAGFLSYWTSNSATPALLGKVATSSIGAGTGLTFSGTAGAQVGGTSGTYSVNTTQNITTLSNLTTAGTVNTTASGLLYSTATSTPTVTSPITYSGTLGSFIGGVSGTFGCASCATFAWPFTPFSGTAVSTTSGLMIFASSTIGNGTQATGLTINGGATTTLNMAILSSLVVGTSTGALGTVNANKGNLFLYNTNTSGSSPSLVMGGNSGGDTDFWLGRTNNNDSVSNDTLQLGAGLVPGTTPVMTWTYQGREGIASTSPFAALSIHLNPTDITAQSTAFAIGSSTATATTTLFSISNVGDVIHRVTNNFTINDIFGTNVVTINTGSTTGSQFTVMATSSVLAQNPNVKLFDVDQYGHLTASSTRAAPTISCTPSGGTLGVNSNDVTGDFTTGTLSTACTLTFANAYVATPEVMVGGGLTSGLTRSTTAVTFTLSAAVTGDDISYFIVQP